MQLLPEHCLTFLCLFVYFFLSFPPLPHLAPTLFSRLLVKNWQLASEVDHSNKEWDASQNGDLTSTPFWKSTKRPTCKSISSVWFQSVDKFSLVLINMFIYGRLHQLWHDLLVGKWFDLVGHPFCVGECIKKVTGIVIDGGDGYCWIVLIFHIAYKY